MSHQISYLEYPVSITKNEILIDINTFAYDPQESDCYHGNLTFHDLNVYENYDKARDAIASFDKGFYSDHAVMFYDYSSGDTNNPQTKWLIKVEWHC